MGYDKIAVNAEGSKEVADRTGGGGAARHHHPSRAFPKIRKGKRVIPGDDLRVFSVSVFRVYCCIFLDSSMVEHSAVNRVVVGSSPTRGAKL